MNPEPDIVRDDDGSIMTVFGGGVTAAGLAVVFASLLGDAWVADTTTAWYSGKKDCGGQDDPDEDHVYPVVCVLLIPAELPAGRDHERPDCPRAAGQAGRGRAPGRPDEEAVMSRCPACDDRIDEFYGYCLGCHRALEEIEKLARCSDQERAQRGLRDAERAQRQLEQVKAEHDRKITRLEELLGKPRQPEKVQIQAPSADLAAATGAQEAARHWAAIDARRQERRIRDLARDLHESRVPTARPEIRAALAELAIEVIKALSAAG
jgi:hypothetical protein